MIMEFYYGVVENILDEMLLGRVQVRIVNVHPENQVDLPTKDLPWALVMAGTTTPGISGIGHSTYLLQGSWVICVPTDNDCQAWMVIGSLPTISGKSFRDISNGFCDAEENFPRKLTEPDNNVRARGGVSTDPDDLQIGMEQPLSSFSPKYPFNHVYETQSGHVKEYDDTPGKERIYQRHKSGTFYELNADGSKVERINGPNYQLVVGDDTIEVIGSVNILTSDNVIVSCAGHLDAHVGGNIIVKGEQNATINIDGIIDIDAGADIRIDTLQSVHITAQDDINLKAFKTLNLDADDDITITSKKSIKIQSGQGEGENIYLNDPISE
jgi:hypothetical protein